MDNNLERISPEKAINMLAKHNHKLTLHEAKIILDILYKLANIVVAQHLRG